MLEPGNTKPFRLDPSQTELFIDRCADISDRMLKALIAEFGPAMLEMRKEMQPLVALIALMGIGSEQNETHKI